MTQIKKTRHRCFLAIVLACLWLLILVPSVTAQECHHLDNLKFYSDGNYKVGELRVESPIDFLHAISSQLKIIKSKLPLQPGDVFTVEKREEGRKKIEAELDAAEKDVDLRARVRVVLAQIENCKETAPKLEVDVVYRVFTTNYNSYLSHTWELKEDEIERPATTAAITQAKGFLTVRPIVGYNHTRRLFAGGLVRLQIPGGIFKTLQFAATGSQVSNVEEFELVGSRSPQMTAMNQLEYRFAYRHSSIPADNNVLREGLLQAQFFGATRPLGTKAVVLRYGASMEGGNQQTNLTSATLAADSVANSGYGGLKTYLGATLRSKDYSFTASYGLQIGTRGATTKVDFTKHIADLAFSAIWKEKNPLPGEVHKPFTLEAQFTAGKIQTSGTLPVTQRFFGGNAPPDFIEGDSWRIRSGPFIRSIPQNRLNSSSDLGAIGGTSFYSANFTVARPVWGYPLIPKEMGRDPDFGPKLNASKESARKGLFLSYLNKRPELFIEILEDLAKVKENDFAALERLLNNIPEELPADAPEKLKDDYEEVRGLVFSDWESTSKVTLKDVNKVNLIDKSKLSSKNFEDLLIELDPQGCQQSPESREKCLVLTKLPSKLETLLNDADPQGCQEDREKCSKLTMLRHDLDRLADLLKGAGLTEAADNAKGIKRSLETSQPELLKKYIAVDKSEARNRADEDMKVVEPVLDTFLKELNWITISPVAVFDAARVWPDKYGTRFGIGGGARITVVNFNVTVGYAFNPNPQPHEGHGALFFTMDITDLFR
ncbi:MAG: hypothetical protein QOH63_2017 [Acidobacteriota bacterium]|jgi:hypothetical protein|nr:hypothetical protein [Acidobacteriota bacterium]